MKREGVLVRSAHPYAVFLQPHLEAFEAAAAVRGPGHDLEAFPKPTLPLDHVNARFRLQQPCQTTQMPRRAPFRTWRVRDCPVLARHPRQQCPRSGRQWVARTAPCHQRPWGASWFCLR